MTMNDIDWFSALAIIFIAMIAVGGWLINRRDDRKAITSNVEANGGKVIGILRTWSGGSCAFRRAAELTAPQFIGWTTSRPKNKWNLLTPQS
jgi:hypothetical protein